MEILIPERNGGTPRGGIILQTRVSCSPNTPEPRIDPCGIGKLKYASDRWHRSNPIKRHAQKNNHKDVGMDFSWNSNGLCTTAAEHGMCHY